MAANPGTVDPASRTKDTTLHHPCRPSTSAQTSASIPAPSPQAACRPAFVSLSPPMRRPTRRLVSNLPHINPPLAAMHTRAQPRVSASFPSKRSPRHLQHNPILHILLLPSLITPHQQPFSSLPPRCTKICRHHRPLLPSRLAPSPSSSKLTRIPCLNPCYAISLESKPRVAHKASPAMFFSTPHGHLSLPSSSLPQTPSLPNHGRKPRKPILHKACCRASVPKPLSSLIFLLQPPTAPSSINAPAVYLQPTAILLISFKHGRASLLLTSISHPNTMLS